MSSIGGPTYKLSSFLAGILSKIVGNASHHIVDSWQFCNEIRKIHIEDSMRLVSLDVVSLFTNVPVDLALKVLHHRWTEIAQHTSINRDDLEMIQAVKFVLEANIFSFNGGFYKTSFWNSHAISNFPCHRQFGDGKVRDCPSLEGTISISIL